MRTLLALILLLTCTVNGCANDACLDCPNQGKCEDITKCPITLPQLPQVVIPQKAASIDPISTVVADIQLQAANLTKAVADKQAAQEALKTADASILDISTKLKSARDILNKLLDDLNNPNKPTTKVITMIELASSTCQPCNAFDPILLELQKEGFPITRIDTDKTKTNYTVKATPSFVMLMDGKEVGRVEGSLSKIKITEWYNAVLIWSKKQP